MEAIRFLQWQYRQFKLWQKFYFLALFCLGFGFSIDNPDFKQYMLTVGFGIILAMVFKWAVVDSAVNSYKEYKRQRDGLFDEIKGN